MIKKVLYYLILTVCGVVLTLFIFAPYGGWLVISDYIKNGLYPEEYALSQFGVKMTGALLWANRMAGFLFWVCLSLPLLLLPLWRVTKNTKMNISFICFAILIAIAFLPKLIGWINYL